MFLYNAKQIAAWDAFTIQHKPIVSINLMEQAATAAFKIINQRLSQLNLSEPIVVFCGNGNNGGDGLAIARMLYSAGFKTIVCTINGSSYSKDYLTNLMRAIDAGLKIFTIKNPADIEKFSSNMGSFIAIDALFGTGLNKTITGLALELVKLINTKANYVFAIDIPSGLFADFENLDVTNTHAIVKADTTITFQIPKQSFMLADTYAFVGEFIVADIGLLSDFNLQESSPYYFIHENDVAPLIKPRLKFSHKGNYGHALIIGGSYGKCGAMVLAAKSALKTGCGLVTAYIPKTCYNSLQTAIPEAMVETDAEETFISNFKYSVNATAIGAGMGMGTDKNTQLGFYKWLMQIEKPVLLDADAINCCAFLMQKKPFKFPNNCVLTPHPKEFDRLVGSSRNSLERLKKQIAFSIKHQVVVVLKGAHTSITTPDGKVYFNSSGNALLATAGSGDVLSGIITSLMAQGLLPHQAAIAGVYLHGLCADMAKQKNYATLLAGDICNFMPFVLNQLNRATL